MPPPLLDRRPVLAAARVRPPPGSAAAGTISPLPARPGPPPPGSPWAARAAFVHLSPPGPAWSPGSPDLGRTQIRFACPAYHHHHHHLDNSRRRRQTHRLGSRHHPSSSPIARLPGPSHRPPARSSSPSSDTCLSPIAPRPPWPPIWAVVIVISAYRHHRFGLLPLDSSDHPTRVTSSFLFFVVLPFLGCRLHLHYQPALAQATAFRALAVGSTIARALGPGRPPAHRPSPPTPAFTKSPTSGCRHGRRRRHSITAWVARQPDPPAIAYQGSPARPSRASPTARPP